MEIHGLFKKIFKMGVLNDKMCKKLYYLIFSNIFLSKLHLLYLTL